MTTSDDLRIGVYVCSCGSNIAGVIDPAEVAEYARTLPGVVWARTNLYMCGDPGQNAIRQDIVAHKLNRVVVAACSVRMHEPTFRACVAEAGLKLHPEHKVKIPDAELFEDYLRASGETGAHPSYTEFRLRSKYSIGVYESRFAGFKNFRKLAIQYGISRGIIVPPTQVEARDEPSDTCPDHQPTYRALDDRPILGEQLDYRGLLHAPVNEIGVVYLFGMLSEELGFVVESIQAGFPDCEGKRKVKKDRWQRVRVEFEYRSSNFVRHAHSITDCDLIVCWIHDWKDCPLEVLSLKDHIQSHAR